MTGEELELKKACANIYNERVDFFNVFSYDIFQTMKEKNVLDIFDRVDLYITMKDGTLKKYNKKTGELENYK